MTDNATTLSADHAFTLPPGYVFHGDAVHHQGEGCMGDPVDYWSRMVLAPSGSLISSGGSSPVDATAGVVRRAVEHAHFHQQDANIRLQALLERARNNHGTFYGTDLLDILTLLAERKS